jgi:trimeric autotransporter adhesin
MNIYNFMNTFTRLIARKSKIIFLIFVLFCSTTISFSQISESFESGLPTSYNSTLSSYSLGSGSWQIKDVISSTSTGVQTGTRSAQIRSATAAQIITPTLTGGVGTITFYVTASTTSGAYQVNISTDDGANWTPAPGSPFSISTTKTLRTITVDNANVNKIQIYRTAATIYIDDFSTTVAPAANPTITTTGTLSALSSIYGTASSTTQFSVSGTNMTAGISVNPPSGFEVSTFSDFSSNVGSNGSPITVGAAGTIAATPVYVRLSATAVPNTYSGNINLTSSGADAKTVATASSTVNQKNLTIEGAVAENKVFDGNTNAFVDFSLATLSGIIGSDDVSINSSLATATFSNAFADNFVPVTVSGVTLSGAQAGRYTVSQPTGLVANILQADQTITFDELDEKTEADLPFSLTATASSGLSVSYSSSNTSVATISGNIVTIEGPGSTTITASQDGDNNFNAATPVDRVLVVNPSGKLNQTITFGALSDVTYGDAAFNLTATASSSLTVSYSSSDTTVATISGNVVSIVGAGSTVITATQEGDIDYNPAPPVNQTLVVLQASLTISDAAAQNKVYDGNTDAQITGTLTGILFSDDVSFNGTGSFATDQVGEDIVVTASAVLTGTDAGNYTLTQPTGLSADITQKSLTINAATANDKVYDGNNTATISGTLSGIVSGDDVILNGTGTFESVTVATDIAVTSTSVLTGSDAGNYTLTQPIGLSADIQPKPLTIQDAAAADKDYDGTLLTTISGTLIGIVGTDDVTLIGTGIFNNKNAGLNKPVTSTSTLDGADAGNYTITQPLGLTADISAIPLTVTDAQAQNKTYDGNTNAIITGTLSGVIGTDVVNLNGTGTFADPNVATGISVTSTSTLSGTDAINYFLTQPTGLSAEIFKAGQTITFGALSNRTFGEAPFNLTATASSSLPVSYSSSDTSVATVSGNTVTITGVGTTTITASQAGNGNYNAATNVQQSLTVLPGIILAWQFGNPESTGSETSYNSTTTASNLSVSSLTRGNGITATALGRGFSATNFPAGWNQNRCNRQ